MEPASRVSIWLSFLAGVFAYSLVFLVYSQVFESRGKAVSGLVSCAGQKRQFKAPFFTLIKKPETHTLCGKLQTNDHDLLVLTRVVAHGLRVYVDGHLTYQSGGEQRTANLWYGVHSIHLPPSKHRKTRKLRIELLGLYDLGLRVLPYTTKWKNHHLSLLWKRFWLQDFLWLITGADLLLASFLFLFALFPTRLRLAYLFAGVGCLLGAFYLQEFTFRETTGTASQFLMARKVFLVSGYTGIWFLLGGIESFFKERIRWALWTSPLLLFLFGAIFWQKDFASLKQATRYAGLLAMIFPVLTILRILLERRPALLGPMAFFAASLSHSAWVLFSKGNAPYLLHLGIVVGNMGIGIFLLQHYQRVQMKLRQTEKKAFLDPLTGAFNRYMLEGLDPSPEDYVVVVDMNKFKYVNDAFGHDKGDELLVEWVNSAQECLRRDDQIFRLGGDEFLLLLASPLDNQLKAIIQRIQENWQKKFTTLPISFSYGFSPVGSSLAKAIHDADQDMFKDKRSHHSLETVETLESRQRNS
jgi:diguanylate cyclase (GGDEF)-like protein